MTVWAKGPAGEAENDEFEGVQIEFGFDKEDVWLVFNREVSAVVMTHEEADELLKQLEDAVAEGRGKLESWVDEKIEKDR